ncbi:hypothetical protein AVEN_51316-1 [Araneus ventricosus]|uniref:Gustatory receptor n=1 Tax=Araneus ventricosus TaxID=182803 RepID=A0A4Y2SIP4_ARAVE|nr:hypothetical protein AVEN_257819-1 [Araneus ventricosus]GBN88337.1 hypothetical protein AVEN_51316-1 [Araneus ventricosus]
MANRKHVSTLLRNIYNLGRDVNAKFNQVWIYAGAMVIVTVPVLAWLTIVLSIDEPFCQNLLVYYGLNLIHVSEGQNCNFMRFLLIFIQFPVISMNTATAVLYVLLCCFSRNILKEYLSNGEKVSPLDCRSFKRYLIFYEQIFEVLSSLEASLSFPILLTVSNNCAFIFYCFMALDPFGKSPWPLAEHFYNFTTLTFLISLLSFLCVTLAASSVGDETKNAKQIQEKLLQRVLASTRKPDRDELMVLFVTHKRPAFTLTAWGFFTFTKGLILPAIGSISTFSLLILQIDSK